MHYSTLLLIALTSIATSSPVGVVTGNKGAATKRTSHESQQLTSYCCNGYERLSTDQLEVTECAPLPDGQNCSTQPGKNGEEPKLYCCANIDEESDVADHCKRGKAQGGATTNQRPDLSYDQTVGPNLASAQTPNYDLTAAELSSGDLSSVQASAVVLN